jgi:hypothetical protein
MLVSYLAHFLILKMEAIYIPPKRRLDFNGLHGLTFQNIEFFILIADVGMKSGRFEILDRYGGLVVRVMK